MMNRVIKFRAWFDDNKSQHMFCVGDEFGTSHPLDCCRYAQQGQPVTLMQFTGLHDKNGVEIYEGDIVQDHIGTGVVEWHIAAFKVNYRDGWAKWFYDYTLKGELESIEVIGNMYQNPELLK